MSVQITIKDTSQLTLEDLVSVVPNSLAAKQLNRIKQDLQQLKADHQGYEAEWMAGALLDYISNYKEQAE